MTSVLECNLTKVNDTTYYLRISKSLGFAISADEAKLLKKLFNKVVE